MDTPARIARRGYRRGKGGDDLARIGAKPRRSRIGAATELAAGADSVHTLPRHEQPKVPAEPPMRPNILLITADQWRGDCLGVAGHKVARTPNIDRLAACGTYFRRHFAQAAPCG